MTQLSVNSHTHVPCVFVAHNVLDARFATRFHRGVELVLLVGASSQVLDSVVEFVAINVVYELWQIAVVHSKDDAVGEV